MSLRPVRKYKSSKFILGTQPYRQLQSSIDMRMQLSRDVTSEIKEGFVPGKPCPEVWKDLFMEPFDKAQKLGQGQYGSARLIRLRSNPTLDLAIKKTKKLELEEVMNTVLAGTLPEVGANPHFNIFYMHLRCEEMDTPLYNANKHQLINWKDAESKIRVLMTQLSQNPTPTRRDALQSQIDSIESRAYPFLEDIHRFHEFKLQQEHAFNEEYGEVEPEKVPPSVARSMKHIRNVYHSMQKVRGRFHEPHEYILMELAEPGAAFKDWIQSAPPASQLISAAFQVCMASLSLMAFFKLTQNDLLLNNITFNPVKPDVYYVYRIGSLYLKVPLYGRLVKIFDFGLTTDAETFYHPTRSGHVPTHWCVGGRGTGKDDQLLCSVYVRDMLEMFYRMLDEYGRPEKLMSRFKSRDKKIIAWLTYAYENSKAVTEDSITSAVKLILDVFHSTTMKKFGLPVTVDIGQTVPPLSIYQSQPFEVINRKKYIKQIHTSMEEKVWDV